MEISPSGVYESTVVKSGNGAVINFHKKFIGKEVLILVKDKVKIGKTKKERDELRKKEEELMDLISWE